jgi:hypothetical protein
LGNERGLAKKETIEETTGAREGRGQHNNRAALQEKLKSTKPDFDRWMKA